MHRIDHLPAVDRSSIRGHIYRVLRDYASGGNHGPLDLRQLYLRVAERLEEGGIVERPLGQHNYPYTQYKRSSQIHPNYFVRPDIADLVRQVLWELFVQRVLAPAPREDLILSLDSVVITPYGVRMLSDTRNRIQVHDPTGYLSNFWGATPAPDPEMMRYLSESVAVFGDGHLLAAVVLLAIASERLIEVLAMHLRDALGEPEGPKWFEHTYNRRDISARFKQLSGKLISEYGNELDQQKLKDGFQRVVTLAFEEIRLARNDIAHPSGRKFTWNEVSGFLHQFVQYFGYANRIIALLSSNPGTAA